MGESGKEFMEELLVTPELLLQFQDTLKEAVHAGWNAGDKLADLTAAMAVCIRGDTAERLNREMQTHMEQIRHTLKELDTEIEKLSAMAGEYDTAEGENVGFAERNRSAL